MIGILKLNYGNVGSLHSFLKHSNYPHKFVGNKDYLRGCSKLIIPGVGNMEFLMSTLEKADLKRAIIEFSTNKQNKLLGICLGMQALLTTSLEYRNGFCLNLIPGEVKRIEQRKNVKLPHIGWNKVLEFNKFSSPLFSDIVDPFFYFSHNYVCSNLSVPGTPELSPP